MLNSLRYTALSNGRGYHIKKGLIAAERDRPALRQARRDWITHRQPRMRQEPHRLVFIDETAVKTNLTRLRGRAPVGERLYGTAPFGKWGTQTFIAGLRCDGLTAPWIVEGAMDGAAFDTYIRTQLAPALEPGDVVICDNLNVHKSPRAAAALAERGAWFLFLPKYSPDLNPIEMAFAKLKTLLRKAKSRTYDALWQAVGDICNLFTQEECWSYFMDAGYGAN